MAKILIVEDDPHINKALRIRLESAGHEIEVASDSYLGFQLAASRVHDLMILDLSMPAGEGFNIVERLQATGGQDVPFVVLTASKRPECRARALELGARDFIEKPFVSKRLVRRVDQALAGAA